MPTHNMYSVEVRHKGLHKYRLIKGSDRYVVEQQASEQMRAWDDMWARRLEIDAKKRERDEGFRAKFQKKTVAAERTEEARAAIAGIEQTLAYSLNDHKKIQWELLLSNSSFPDPPPAKREHVELPPEPKETDGQFRPDKRWYHLFLTNVRQAAQEDAKRRFSRAHEEWSKKIAELKAANARLDEEHAGDVSEWKSRKESFEAKQAETNKQVIAKKEAYLKGDAQAITEFCELVISSSRYPENFPNEWDLEFQPTTKTLLIDYFLPSPAELPTLKEVKYVASRDTLSEVQYPVSVTNKLYDDLLYQITLRTINELYRADHATFIDSIVFNGWVRSIDKGTGKQVTACILSIQAARQEFLDIDLSQVEPKECFRTLKGVGSSKLHGLAPVAPILKLNTEDKRFVSSYSVIGDVDQSTNLAAMDWEDFEHLIRQLFEEEFAKSGGEVKITQASRDGGVDAVAFDPDPIRGGKIVIQAKRYTNPVGVSAVRDLYGTIMNEGATKGILVTTADYGPDSYAFAKGKPITLLTGANLLHLLAEHGHKATIDLKAAKQMLADLKKDGE